MSYKITIPKKGQQVGSVVIETLDSTSCEVVQEVCQQYGSLKSYTPMNHGDETPLYDTVNLNK